MDISTPRSRDQHKHIAERCPNCGSPEMWADTVVVSGGVLLCGSRKPVPPTPASSHHGALLGPRFIAGPGLQRAAGSCAPSWALPPRRSPLGRCFVVLMCLCSEEMFLFCFAWSCRSLCLSVYTHPSLRVLEHKECAHAPYEREAHTLAPFFEIKPFMSVLLFPKVWLIPQGTHRLSFNALFLVF